MNEREREDVFLINAALGTDLLTSCAAASDDEPRPPRKPSGCLFVVSLIFLAAVLLAW